MGIKSVINIEEEASLIGSSGMTSDMQAEIDGMSDAEIEEKYKEIPNADNSTLGVPTSSQRAVILASEKQGIVGESRGLYINMVLPEYNEDLSYFKGTLRVLNTQTQQSITLTINRNSSYPEIETQGQLSSFVVRENNGLITAGINKPEKYSYFDESKDKFIIYYKVGEFSGNHDVYYQLQYWMKKRKDNKEDNPLIYTYSYKAEA